MSVLGACGVKHVCMLGQVVASVCRVCMCVCVYLSLSVSLSVDGENDTARSNPVPCARARTRNPRVSDSVPPMGVPTGGSAIQGKKKLPPDAFRRQGGAAT